MKNIGFLMLHIDDGEMSQAILNSVDQIIQKDPLNHYTLFASSVDTVVSPRVPILHMDYAKYFDGDIWCFDINALQFNKTLKTSKIFFYASNTPWVQHYNLYEKWRSLFNDPNINIVAANAMLYDIYEICWKKPETIMENLSYEQIKQFI